ncbi:hypothetical protein TcYC6_0112080 [Trypanosoma cruzi]|nr:hypothetical protein TcYC6_0112080 [Trypanosoma cruzi]
MELIRQRRSSVVRRNTDISALGRPHKEGERCGLINVGAVSVEAENAPSGRFSTFFSFFFFFLPHARTADERGELRCLVGGNIRSGAIDPTAAHQDAAVHVGNESNPAGNGDSGVTKNSVAIGTKQARPLTKEWLNQPIRSRTDWKERVVFRLVWITASRLFEIVALTPKHVTLEPNGTLILY